MTEEKPTEPARKPKDAARDPLMRPPELPFAGRHGQQKGWPLEGEEGREKKKQKRARKEERGEKSEERRKRREVERVTRITGSRHHQTTTGASPINPQWRPRQHDGGRQ